MIIMVIQVECLQLEIYLVKAKNLIDATYESMMKGIKILKTWN